MTDKWNGIDCPDDISHEPDVDHGADTDRDSLGFRRTYTPTPLSGDELRENIERFQKERALYQSGFFTKRQAD